MTRVTVDYARRVFPHLIADAIQARTTYRIGRGRNAVILMPAQDYDGIVETMELLAVPGLRASLRRSMLQVRLGQTRSDHEVFATGVPSRRLPTRRGLR